MSGPLSTPDLLSLHNCREAFRLAAVMDHIVDQSQPLPAVTASASLFITLCAQRGADPVACLSQILGHIQARSFALPSSEYAALTPWARHQH